MLIAHTDDPKLLDWIINAQNRGGSFVQSIAHAALVADYENYPLLRPVLLALRKKYPEYDVSPFKGTL